MKPKTFRYYVPPTEDCCGYYITSNQRGFKFLPHGTVAIDNFGLVSIENIEESTGVKDGDGNELFDNDENK